MTTKKLLRAFSNIQPLYFILQNTYTAILVML